MNISKVNQAVELQKQINTDIDVFGCTSEYNANMLERLADSMNYEECDLFIELMDSHNLPRTLTV
jgi:hypothetical protein